MWPPDFCVIPDSSLFALLAGGLRSLHYSPAVPRLFDHLIWGKWTSALRLLHCPRQPPASSQESQVEARTVVREVAPTVFRAEGLARWFSPLHAISPGRLLNRAAWWGSAATQVCGK